MDAGLTVEEYENCLSDAYAKANHMVDMDWQEIIEKYNLNIHYDTLRKATQTIFGGAFVSEYFKSKSASYDSDSYLHELRLEKQEVQKERQKMFDERTELKRNLRQQARRESFIDLVKREIEKIPAIGLEYDNQLLIESDNDLICHLTDIHAGIGIDNYFNKFNTSILKQRLASYLDQLFSIQFRHHSENCYLVIGEIMSGLIHESLRIENNENVIEQFIIVSKLISEMICEIAAHFNNVYVYITPGNHSRVVANKDFSLKGENFDVLLPHYLKASLQNYQNVHIERNVKDCDIAMFTVRNSRVFAAHGDKDNPDSVVQKYTMMFSVKPDIILLGHRHTNGMSTVYDTKVIQSGCVSGSDNYCLDKRLKNRPEQTISVVDDNGFVCLYDIQLD